ncbi:PfkB family carbohydrate kinase [Halalkalibacter alkalisediminis]|uniref:PfkB family carbohydrate kinase n=1 Tax=Halalkalibacter alkalisediminis TaxID=935616 RepID=A0ABV6NGJ5_9BACI|nr:hypothetical protein [Halalkalibacter alkalisediminis]
MNQAVAATKLGGMTLIGCVGEENFGKELKAQFFKEGIRLCLGTELTNLRESLQLPFQMETIA